MNFIGNIIWLICGGLFSALGYFFGGLILCCTIIGIPFGIQCFKIAGLVLVRQRPGTAGGICFMTIEDESGFANLVIFQNLFDEYRKPILQSRLIMVEGTLQVEGEVIHVIVRACYDFSKLLRHLTPSRRENLPVLTLARPDEKSIPPPQNKRTQVRETAQEKIFPEARNFK